jgi:16S rRNA (uracil1498-N3)-methyltransferase
VDPACLEGGEGTGEVTLGELERRYLCRVLRLGPGDRVELFDGQGNEVEAEIAWVEARRVALRLLGRREGRRAVGPEMVLLQALAKGDRFDLVVQKATELGVGRIVPVMTARSVERLAGDRAAQRRERWCRIAQEAARQCRRADVPEISPVMPLGEALAVARPEGLRLLLWEGAAERGQGLGPVLPAEAPGQVVVAVGPEGGFTEDEVRQAALAGFRPVGLGPRVLRTETAALAALAILGFVLGDLRD